jgi:preprotein translocase subunit SecE
MADVDEKKAEEGLELAEVSPKEPLVAVRGELVSGGSEGDALGTEKYVFISFFAAAIGIAFLVGKTLTALWNRLAEEAWVARQVPILLRFPEDERPMFTMALGGVVGVISLFVLLRNDRLRRWADDVATELSKVTWPKREMVTNGTIVCIAAGIFATVYIGLLDRLWAFVTMLVYGA